MRPQDRAARAADLGHQGASLGAKELSEKLAPDDRTASISTKPRSRLCSASQASFSHAGALPSARCTRPRSLHKKIKMRYRKRRRFIQRILLHRCDVCSIRCNRRRTFETYDTTMAGISGKAENGKPRSLTRKPKQEGHSGN